MEDDVVLNKTDMFHSTKSNHELNQIKNEIIEISLKVNRLFISFLNRLLEKKSLKQFFRF